MVLRRAMLHNFGVWGSLHGQKRQERWQHFKNTGSVSEVNLCLSMDYTMSLLRTVAKDLRHRHHSLDEADAICARAYADDRGIDSGGGGGCRPQTFGLVILLETWGDTREENDEIRRNRDPAAETALDVANRKAWHANKTLNIQLYDDLYGPTPPDAEYLSIIRPPEVIASERKHMIMNLSGVQDVFVSQ